MTDVLAASADTAVAEVEKELIADGENFIETHSESQLFL